MLNRHCHQLKVLAMVDQARYVLPLAVLEVLSGFGFPPGFDGAVWEGGFVWCGCGGGVECGGSGRAVVGEGSCGGGGCYFVKGNGEVVSTVFLVQS